MRRLVLEVDTHFEDQLELSLVMATYTKRQQRNLGRAWQLDLTAGHAGSTITYR